MRTKLWLAVMAVTVLGTFVAMSVAGAETLSQKGRNVYHITKVEAIQIGDVPGHVIGVAEARGLTFIENGEVAAYTARFLFDYTDGSGPAWAYGVITYQDGSTTVTKAQGTTTALPGGAAAHQGTYFYIKGTGRFEGITGSGSYTTKRVAPLAPGGLAYIYTDWSDTYTLPSR